ncbi:transcriptional regulator [Streptomyces sp. NBC_01020]|uniref:transcriptional regulator n=1 Tax=unclassified Streptomyces TaxID=2593676 RepID=UPI00325483F7|nr:transcriptional regulator [Streptomyces sp. NBC_01020]
MAEQEPESGLREVVHQRVRLGVLAIVDRRGPCTFSQLRDALGQSNGSLSRHLGVLEEHGYITTEKVFENRRPRTWVRMTAAGAEVFREEQELLTKLLTTASQEAGRTGTDPDEDRVAAMSIVFAALLADDDTAADTARDARADGCGEDASPGRIDHSTLLPTDPVLAGRRAEPLRSGPISARYDMPAGYASFTEQREQRLMLMSHGLRGGWITSWPIVGPEHNSSVEDGGEQEGQGIAHAIVVELGGASDCTSILAVMNPSAVDVGVPAARGYLLPANEDGAPATAVAWFSVGRYLVSIAVAALADIATAVMKDLAVEVYRPLSTRHP